MWTAKSRLSSSKQRWQCQGISSQRMRRADHKVEAEEGTVISKPLRVLLHATLTQSVRESGKLDFNRRNRNRGGASSHPGSALEWNRTLDREFSPRLQLYPTPVLFPGEGALFPSTRRSPMSWLTFCPDLAGWARSVSLSALIALKKVLMSSFTQSGWENINRRLSPALICHQVGYVQLVHCWQSRADVLRKWGYAWPIYSVQMEQDKSLFTLPAWV